MSCTPTVANHTITIATGQAPRTVTAVLNTAKGPEVTSVVFTNVNGVNGATLAYHSGAASVPPARFTRNGNTYVITGTATDPTNKSPAQPFVIDATCPS